MSKSSLLAPMKESKFIHNSLSDEEIFTDEVEPLNNILSTFKYWPRTGNKLYTGRYMVLYGFVIFCVGFSSSFLIFNNLKFPFRNYQIQKDNRIYFTRDVLMVLQQSHPDRKIQSNVSSKNIELTNYDEILMLRDHFKTYNFDEISPILKSSVVLTFKNKKIPDAIEIVVNNAEIRYRNVRNASYTYVIPEEVEDIRYFTNNVSGLPVYGNFGSEDDFRFLTEQGISLRGCIILLRLGKISIFEKVSRAFKRGVSGVLLFADPQQYPQMGCLSVSEEIPPTQLTDLLEFHSSFRTNCNSNCSIPLQIIESMTARNILREMVVMNKSPDSWHGSLNALYSVGPGFVYGDWRLVMYSYFVSVRYTTYDIVAYLRSTHEADRYVIVANSRKTLNSKEKTSESTNALLEVSKTLARMKIIEGWKPSRTLVFCSFGLKDIESYSSDSWSQTYLNVIKQRSVAFLNIKQPIQGLHQLNVEVNPLLKELFSNMSSVIANPNKEERLGEKKSLFDVWRIQERNFNKNYIEQYSCEEGNYSNPLDTETILNFNFDTTNVGGNFFDSLGIPTIAVGYSNQSGDRKISVDVESIVSIYEYENSIIQLWILLIFSLSNERILPFNVSAYCSVFENLNDQLTQHKLLQNTMVVDDFDKFNQSVMNLTHKIRHFQKEIQSFDVHDSLQYRTINDKLMQMERLFACVKTAYDTLLNVLNKMLSTEVKIMKKLMKRGANCVAEIDYLIANPFH